LADRSS